MWIWRHGLNTNQKMQSWTFNGHMNIEIWFLRCRVLVPFWVWLKKNNDNPNGLWKWNCCTSQAWHFACFLGVTCEQTPWPHRNRPLLHPWRAISPASPRRSWATSWRTNTCATAATISSDGLSKPSVDIASVPTALTGLWGEEWNGQRLK